MSALFMMLAMPALAQVTADGTVGTVVTGGGSYSITGGTQRLTTLFHSFCRLLTRGEPMSLLI
ncbi:MAG: hypothetical protein HC800_18935 [Phormidesmis sp. RL_2_1]|nr:hypothetical protein [Phormidesmis sp. RL_2_1]